MTMPITTTWIRHGKSESNMTISLAKKGTPHPKEKELKKVHTSKRRLHTLGVEQAQKTGIWLLNDIDRRATVFGYDNPYSNTKFFTSPYARTAETALEIGLPVKWEFDDLLCERNWGVLDHLTYDEHLQLFKEEITRQRTDALFWIPRDGESLLHVKMRLTRFFDMLERDCSQDHVYVSTHGEVMWSVRCMLEYWLPKELADRMLSEESDQQNKIINCRIIQYSRQISDDSAKLADDICRVRLVDPANPDDPKTNLDWQPIQRRKFDLEQLRAYVDQFEHYLK